jgi:hypothetical protein
VSAEDGQKRSLNHREKGDSETMGKTSVTLLHNSAYPEVPWLSKSLRCFTVTLEHAKWHPASNFCLSRADLRISRSSAISSIKSVSETPSAMRSTFAAGRISAVTR